MPYVIRDRMTGQALTSTTNSARAAELCCGFEQYRAVDDIGARNHYWYLRRLPMGQPHPYDVGAAEILAARRDELIAHARVSLSDC